MAFDPEKLNAVKKSQFDPDRLKNLKEPDSLLKKTGKAALKAGEVALEVASAPLEVAGESLRTAVEQRPGDFFRAPSIVQRMLPGTKTNQPPSIGFDVVNKLLRAGAAFGAGLPGGVDAAQEMALKAYNAERGTMGAVEDTALSLLAGKIPLPGAGTSIAEAPFKAAGEAIKKTGEATKYIGKKGIRAGLGVSEEAQSARFRRPGDLKAAKSEADLAFDIEKGHKVVESKIKVIEDDVSRVLRTSSDIKDGAVPKEQILNVIKNARQKIGMTVTNQEKYAKQVLDDLYNNLNQMRTNVSEKQVRDVVQKVRDAVSYGSKEYGKTDLGLMEVAKRTDSFLKRNKDYAELMKQEAPLQRLKSDLVDNFGLKRSVGEGFVATDATSSKLKNILGETKEVKSQKILERLSGVTGQDYIKNVKDYKLAGEFKGGIDRSRGSRRTALGGLTGLALEPFIPGPAGSTAFLGGMAGGAADIYGGSMAGKLIDLLRGGQTKTGNLLNLLQRQTSKTPIQSLLESLDASMIAPAVAATRER